MKTRTLLVMAVLAASALCVNAQKLLISEEFSSTEWQDELLRLNPGGDELSQPINPNAPNLNPYAARTPSVGETGNYAYTNMNLTDLYFGKYKIAGDMEIINGELHPMSDTCALDGGNHNVMITEGDSTGVYMPIGLRPFKGNGYIELPEISSAGLLTVHLLSGNIKKASTLYIEKWENETWTVKTTKNIKKRNNIDGKVDQIQTEDINSRVPIKLRLANSDGTVPFFVIFEFSVEEHASIDLKQSIDSAVAIRSANAGNIGTGAGQYPQAVYDSLGVVIDSINSVYNDLTKGRDALITATTDMNEAITYFYDNINIINGFNPASSTAIKQYGRVLEANKPVNIAIYNTVGTLVYQQDQVQVMEIPATVGKGIFIVKSGFGVQKIYLGE
jgi:hypothetical protein